MSFNSNGFSLGSSSAVNNNTKTFVGWAWKAGGNKNTFNVDDVGYATFAASGTTAGTITPTGTSIGTKQGFSIIKYTGTGSVDTSLPHGLHKHQNSCWSKILIVPTTGQYTTKV